MNQTAAVPARLERAASLQVRPVGSGGFIVSGGERPHRVLCQSVLTQFNAWCDCEDFRAGRGMRACKHVLAVAITLASDEERAAIAAMLGISA